MRTVIETRNDYFEYEGRCRIDLDNPRYIRVLDRQGNDLLILPIGELESIEFQKEDDFE